MAKQSLLLEALGVAIAKKRLVLDLSQQELAVAAGVHRSYMSDVERGLRNITLGSLENIASALQTTPADLIKSAQAAIELQSQTQTCV